MTIKRECTSFFSTLPSLFCYCSNMVTIALVNILLHVRVSKMLLGGLQWNLGDWELQNQKYFSWKIPSWKWQGSCLTSMLGLENCWLIYSAAEMVCFDQILSKGKAELHGRQHSMWHGWLFGFLLYYEMNCFKNSEIFPSPHSTKSPPFWLLDIHLYQYISYHPFFNSYLTLFAYVPESYTHKDEWTGKGPS